VAAEFLTLVGAVQTAFKTFQDWYLSLSRRDSQVIDDVNKIMEAAGFDLFGEAAVWRRGDFYFYYVGNHIPERSYDACMPCVPLGDPRIAVNMFEGPALVALSDSASYYKGLNRATPAAALLPMTDKVVTPATASFSTDWSMRYDTQVGYVTIDHHLLERRKGLIRGSYKCRIHDDPSTVIEQSGDYNFQTSS
jgi:hypothetical protein